MLDFELKVLKLGDFGASFFTRERAKDLGKRKEQSMEESLEEDLEENLEEFPSDVNEKLDGFSSLLGLGSGLGLR